MQNQISTISIFPKNQWHHFHQVLALSEMSNYLNGNNLKQMSTCHSLMYLWKKLRQCFHSLRSRSRWTYWIQEHCQKSLICLMNMMWITLTNSSVTMVMTNLIFIRPLMLKKLYSRTCLNYPLHKTTTRLRRQALSPPKEIPIQSLLYKTTTCLARPATTSFVSQVKKNCLKWSLQNFTQQRNGKQTWTMHKK